MREVLHRLRLFTIKNHAMEQKKYLIFLISILLCPQIVASNFSQKEVRKFKISGNIIDRSDREPLAFVAVSLYKNNIPTGIYSVTDTLGNFSMTNLPMGTYTIVTELLGYESYLSQEFQLKPKGIYLELEMDEDPRVLDALIFTAKRDPFRKNAMSPLSKANIGTFVIEKSPGANRDISKVIYSLPGVAGVNGSSAYRNDILVRGGGPSENTFYMDGIELPAINHFSTQGATGGPVGMINADLIREVDFYTGSFPVSKRNALSSVMDIKLKDGSLVSNNFSASIGASEFAFSAEGHFSEKTTYLFSARTSYLQFLFKLLDLPFLPTFTDAQFKIKTKIDKKNEISFIGLVGIDDLKLNVDDSEKEINQYLLSYLPTIKQEIFTVGAIYKHYYEDGNLAFYLSHSYLNNRNKKYSENDESSEDNLVLKYRSIESETKLRVENTLIKGKFKIIAGIGLNLPYYINSTFQKFSGFALDYSSDLLFLKYSIFASASYKSANKKFSASLSLRTDGNSYSKTMANPLNQLSPKFSLSYQFYKNMYLNFSIGRSFQLPPYTAMGYKNMEGVLINKENDIKYIGNNNIALGLEYRPLSNLKLSVEGFYKRYFNNLVSADNMIPIYSNSTDFGVVGNEEVLSILKGSAYGLEFGGRWFVNNRLSMLLSYTYFRSVYDKPKKYISSWDNRHLLTFAGGYEFKYDIRLGAKFRFSGGSPYTPYDEEMSSYKLYWDTKGRAVIDYTKFNSLRLPNFTQLDLRVDKGFNFKKFSLLIYVDIQNILNTKYKSPDVLMSTGKIINPDAPINEQKYELKYIPMKDGTILPTLGVTFMF